MVFTPPAASTDRNDVQNFVSTIVQNITASIQISPGLMGRAAGDLLHPLLIRMSGDSRHADPAAFQMKEEQYIVGRLAPPAQYFHGAVPADETRIHSLALEYRI